MRLGSSVSRLAAAIALLLPLVAAVAAFAHPSWRGTLDLTVASKTRVAVRARITMEEVTVTEIVLARGGETVADTSIEGSCRRHAEFLSRNIRLRIDGRDLAPRVVEVAPPDPQGDEAVYVLEYTAPGDPAERGGGAADASPGALELRSTVLEDRTTAAGMPWDVTYVVNVKRPDGRRAEGLLLTTGTPLTVSLGGDAPAEGDATGDGLWAYLRHGIHHILIGWDHLLFVSALVLAASSLWDLVKVVTAFTLAHTCTLALSALDVVRLPSAVVEPMIAASIVVVALQNVVRPESAKGWGRLGVAFAFGLFHGLGFAGGLLDAMRGLDGARVLGAIAAFSVGVEVGHQVIVIPLFLVLALVRRRDAARTPGGSLAFAQVRRWGSSLVSVAGAVYLFLALESAFAG